MTWTLIFASALLLHGAVSLLLTVRQARSVAAHRPSVPTDFAGHISLADHQKAADYTRAKLGLNICRTATSAAVLLGWTMWGGLDALNQLSLRWQEPGWAQQMLLLGAFLGVSAVLDLPWSWYQTFRLEARFGFNRSTYRIWLADLAKGSLLGLVLGGTLAACALWIMSASDVWWWWVWLIWMGFNLLLMWVFPTFIAPLFNKFEPLKDEALKGRIESLIKRCGFELGGVLIMDGSQRSAHANAYFTGLGRAKRVVFYDTLMNALKPEEMEAVLAHELGHFRHGHLYKRLFVSAAVSLGALATLGWLSEQLWFYSGLGVTPSFALSDQLQAPNDALALILFSMLGAAFFWLAAPLSAWWSRRHEYEADAFAASQTSGIHLANALLRLYRDNASTLTPDPWYAAFHHSHPSAAQRLQRLRST